MPPELTTYGDDVLPANALTGNGSIKLPVEPEKDVVPLDGLPSVSIEAGGVSLNGLAVLNNVAIARLLGGTSGRLGLKSLKNPSPEILTELCKEGKDTLNYLELGIEDMTYGQGKILGSCSRYLILDQLSRWEKGALRALLNQKMGWVSLGGIATLDPEQTKEIAGGLRNLDLKNVTKASLEALRHLADLKFGVRVLLPRLKIPDEDIPRCAAIFSRCKGMIDLSPELHQKINRI